MLITIAAVALAAAQPAPAPASAPAPHASHHGMSGEMHGPMCEQGDHKDGKGCCCCGKSPGHKHDKPAPTPGA